MICTCKCNHCGNGIEFEAEHAGQFAACPSCEKNVQLVAGTKHTKEQIGRDKPESNFKKLSPVERRLYWLGNIYLLLAIMVGALVFFFGLATGLAERKFSDECIFAMIGGICLAFQGFIFDTVCLWGVDISKHLRRMADK